MIWDTHTHKVVERDDAATAMPVRVCAQAPAIADCNLFSVQVRTSNPTHGYCPPTSNLSLTHSTMQVFIKNILRNDNTSLACAYTSLVRHCFTLPHNLFIPCSYLPVPSIWVP